MKVKSLVVRVVHSQLIHLWYWHHLQNKNVFYKALMFFSTGISEVHFWSKTHMRRIPHKRKLGFNSCTLRRKSKDATANYNSRCWHCGWSTMVRSWPDCRTWGIQPSNVPGKWCCAFICKKLSTLIRVISINRYCFKLYTPVAQSTSIGFVHLPSRIYGGDLDLKCRDSRVMGWGDQTPKPAQPKPSFHKPNNTQLSSEYVHTRIDKYDLNIMIRALSQSQSAVWPCSSIITVPVQKTLSWSDSRYSDMCWGD